MDPEINSSKMPENLLKRMEQKIFNTKPDTHYMKLSGKNVDVHNFQDYVGTQTSSKNGKNPETSQNCQKLQNGHNPSDNVAIKDVQNSLWGQNGELKHTPAINMNLNKENQICQNGNQNVEIVLEFENSNEAIKQTKSIPKIKDCEKQMCRDNPLSKIERSKEDGKRNPKLDQMCYRTLIENDSLQLITSKSLIEKAPQTSPKSMNQHVNFKLSPQPNLEALPKDANQKTSLKSANQQDILETSSGCINRDINLKTCSKCKNHNVKLETSATTIQSNPERFSKLEICSQLSSLKRMIQNINPQTTTKSTKQCNTSPNSNNLERTDSKCTIQHNLDFTLGTKQCVNFPNSINLGTTPSKCTKHHNNMETATNTLTRNNPHLQSQPQQNPPKRAIYSSLNNPKQFPRELIQQLSQHERFNSKSPSEKSLEVINLGNPEINFRESNVQFESFDSASSTSGKRSSSVPPQRRPVKFKNPRNVDLFNASYAFEKVNNHLTSMGRGLLESIRTKVFGFQQSSVKKDDDEWAYDPNTVFPISKLPKETRYATTNLNFKNKRYRLCDSCSKSFNETKLIDAQTSPMNSETDVSSKQQKTKIHKIPCPLNILCDRGIHLGKCEDYVREKTRGKVICPKHCISTLEQAFGYSGIKEYPGRAEKPVRLKTFSDDGSGSTSCISLGSNSDISIGVEAKSSMDTILKLMEPQMHDSDFADRSLPDIPVKIPLEPSTSKFVGKKMNGMNGHANGDLNGCGDIITQNQQKGCWTIGLINSKYRYLTAETFGFKINANGASLKKKQIWTLEPESANNGDSLIYLRSHLDKYLAVDSFGNVTCESEEKEPGCQFQISVSEDGSGRWALKNVVRGYFLGSTSDKLTCTAKVPGDAEFWHTHLAARPQVNLRSVGRKRFAHLSENLDEIHVDANIPWGEDTLFTLEFRLDESGKYAIHTCNNKYLSMGGKLVDSCNKDCLFSAEYHSGQLALRDRTGAYLSPIGSKAVLKTRSNTVTKDELFSLEDSLPQASFVASLNSRFVSVKQGVDVTANQDEISDHETFQLEFDWSTKRWYIRTMQDRYWTLETGGGIQASGDKRSSNALFDLVWQGDGSLAFRANNGRYVITKRSGHLYATADTIDDNCKYFFYLINRPILVLKCEQGFVGYKSTSNPKLECNKATYECIQVERGEKGVVFFKGQNGKYWHADSEGVNADSDTQEGFYLELREPTRLCIKSLNGNYLTASKNGLFRLGDTNIENATQWEY